ncbi:MAG TPA: NAD(P)H nitroreductase [Halieaceae bacterium]|jgi:nitroreductase|uniref:Putative NAD(P)H nitroreductase n=2 Tax=Haliea salexigens TaxID=287487 RepID=A0A3C1KJP1_9GAMM|nr:NAD(P)H nitroreductase [Haliea sp.]HAN26902.1 NAD(P)H nitroreductase [Haliea salexigens]HAN67707.1 NAD(P)H nitroreductase [Halieaceae bacterium]MAA87184.1 NAD(P)H nitroreductase [Haliea sp.]MAD64879.1 NAD(P)H nitroreductase [Haliea sp.]MAY94672.1 NAD(P)H nitroreductase [Haliea sp.]|tara:strand:- start:4413 stop:4970 length:558 start_codon:yes stop_codon:yes gene_type:complete
MSDVLHHLQTRNSAPRLQAPAPSAEELEQILQAGLRAPDHAWLRPWRFIVIEGERREDFGEVLERCLLQRDPAAHSSAREKARGAPLRAPLLLVVVARLQEHPKVPQSEQRLSAGCAAHAILLAAEALGYAGIWRTGNAAFDPFVGAALGLEPGEEVVSFLYLGTRDGNPKTLPTLNTADFVNRW